MPIMLLTSRRAVAAQLSTNVEREPGFAHRFRAATLHTQTQHCAPSALIPFLIARLSALLLRHRAA